MSTVKAMYEISLPLKGDEAALVKIYPELLRCLQCNTCTRVCPQEVDMMACMAAAMRSDIRRVAETSFECIMCGTCAAKCPAELSQHQIALLARRIYGMHILPSSPDLQKRIREIRGGEFERILDALVNLDKEDLIRIYLQREKEPQDDTGWKPQNRDFPLDQLFQSK